MKFMKSIFAAMTSIAVFALAACGGNANAATLSHNFVDDAGINFSIKSAYSVEKVAGQVKVANSNGVVYTYTDASGALYTKLLNYMAGSASYYQVGGTLLHMNVTETTQITCPASATTFAYPSGNYSRVFVDSCANLNAINNASN